jgi:hypothetical protein
MPTTMPTAVELDIAKMVLLAAIALLGAFIA